MPNIQKIINNRHKYKTDTNYQTRLDPPPADLRVAHKS